MHTQCPYCLTVYQPRAAQLAAGRGELRCGVCERSFDALEYLSDAPVASRAARVPLAEEAPRVEPFAMPEQGELFRAAGTAPAFLARGHGVAVPQGARWWLLAVVLSLSLAAQIVLAQRDQLAVDPGLRPWLSRLCDVAGCVLQPWQAPEQVRLTAREVRPHPSVDGALLITATIRNESLHPLAWPVLELSLLDLSGEPVALRRFRATEYLGGEPAVPALLPGQSANAALEVADPGKQALAFAFEFL